MRWPKRSCVCSTGGWAFACAPQSIGAPPQNVPAAWRRSRQSRPASRSSASASATLSAKRSRSASGGGWFVTSWVALRASVDDMRGLRVRDGGQAEGDEVGDERVGVRARRDGGQRPHERRAERADERGGDEVGVAGAQLAGGDPVAKDLREVGGMGA